MPHCFPNLQPSLARTEIKHLIILAEAHASCLQHMAAPDERQAQGRSSSPGRSSFQPSTASASVVSMPLGCSLIAQL